MVVQPFDLEQEGPHQAVLLAHLQPERALDGHREGEGMADGRVPAEPLGERYTVRGLRPSKSFSMPRWTNHSRAFIRTMVSPTTENLKCPGSIIPACTGPTGIS